MNITTISPSKLQMYSDCPRCFLLCIEGKPQKISARMTFGSRVHKAIEQYHKYGKTEFDEDLQEYLNAYMEMYDQEFQVCEEFWKVPLFDTGVLLSMRVDLVKDDMLIDHKTSDHRMTQEYADKLEQLTAYSWAWSQQFTEKEKLVRINLFNTNPRPGEELFSVIDTERTEEHFFTWEEWVREILDGIAANAFEPKKAIWHNYEECPLYKTAIMTEPM